METSVTTMSRRLSECGTSYRSLVDGVRFKQAKELAIPSLTCQFFVGSNDPDPKGG
jgi:hypothetical protein